MDFKLSEEQLLLAATVRRFAQKEVGPRAYEIDRDEKFPHDNFKRMGEMGLLGISIPIEYGGSGGTYMGMMIVAEELAAVYASTSIAFGANADLFSDNLYRNASENLKKRYLPPMCAGEMIGGIAMTEPEAGSYVTSLASYAKLYASGGVYEGNHRSRTGIGRLRLH